MTDIPDIQDFTKHGPIVPKSAAQRQSSREMPADNADKTRSASPRPRFSDLLIEKGFLSERDCNRLRAVFPNDDFALLLHLVSTMPSRATDLGRLWGDCFGLAFVDLTKTLIQYELSERLPESFAKKNLLLPIYEFAGGITMAMPGLMNPQLLQQAENHLNAFVSPVFCFPDQIKDAIAIAYQSKANLAELLEESRITAVQSKDCEVSVAELKRVSGGQAIIDFARGLMLLALKQRASDIHIEPGEHKGRIRFRIDGVLREAFVVETALLAPVVARLKILADADIAESRKPQDGRLKVDLSERAVDLRFSCVPTIYGEKVVMRILGKADSSGVPELKDIGISRTILEPMTHALRSPNGVFYVTGPTGSGKTTTLYSMLQHLNKDGVNIVTIEDPVEYRLAGLNQVQVNETAGLTFASALRSFLRQDPDIMLVGEIRDLETAAIAAQAALTGHLVLTTMHTNSAIKTISRLADIGVDTSLAAPSMIGILAQRLVRRLCDNCKEKRQLKPEEIERLFIWDSETDVHLYHPKGCAKCSNIGFTGRIGIHEFLAVDDEIRALIADNASLHEIAACARKKGLTSLRYDGFKKALRGLTTTEEVDRVAYSE